MPLSNYLILLIVLNYRWVTTLATMLQSNSLSETTQKLLALVVIVVVVILMIGLTIIYSKGKNNPNSIKTKWWHYAIFVGVFYLSSYAALTNYYLHISAFFSVVILGAMTYQVLKKKTVK